MGNFYVNHAIRTADMHAVVKALEGRNAFVAPAQNGVIVVADERADEQSEKEVKALGDLLSQRLAAPVLGAMVHDDDLFWCGLFESGRIVDEYDSCPGYFTGDPDNMKPRGGDAAKLCAAFGAMNHARVEAILRGDYTFEHMRHAALVHALGLPDYAVHLGYKYIERGDDYDGLSLASLTRTSRMGGAE